MCVAVGVGVCLSVIVLKTDNNFDRKTKRQERALSAALQLTQIPDQVHCSPRLPRSARVPGPGRSSRAPVRHADTLRDVPWADACR